MGFFNRKQKSGAVAKNRLQLVLFQDRTNISPGLLEMLKTDLLKVLMNYMEIDESALDIKLSPPGQPGESEGGPALEVNIPIKGWKKR